TVSPRRRSPPSKPTSLPPQRRRLDSDRKDVSMVTTLSPALFDQVEEALKDVVDPELGVNVVDLGLIYDLAWDDENDALIISMTLTSAGCPLTDVTEEQTGQA